MNGSLAPVEWGGTRKSYRFHTHDTRMILNYRKIRIEYRITRETGTKNQNDTEND